MDTTEVLIAGAGPTGLVLALWLARQGVRVRLIDKDAGPGETSRAMAVQARTLELYRQLGLAEEVVAAGKRNPAVNVWVGGKQRARLDFRDAGRQLTPFPFVLIFPQDQHERLLLRHLEAAGVRVERRTELLDFEQDASQVGGQVRARLRLPDGSEQTCTASWLAGCDGAHSTVRHGIGAGFEGGTYAHTFYVADVEAEGAAADGEIHLSLEESDFCALFAYGRPGQGRLIGAVQDAERPASAEPLGFEDVRQRAIASLGLQVRQVNWFSTYRVHHRIADRYRGGRAFLLGDAAHVHSPAGGQGMNTGIGDAINLAWKLAAVLRERAPQAVLDTYQAERQAFARRLVETTDRVFSAVTAQGQLADFVRKHVAPLFVSAVDAMAPGRELFFRTLSQCAVSYHDSALSSGSAGRVRGGDRLPWIGHAGPDNHASLSAIDWQVHVYGEASPALAAWCEQAGVALHVFAWDGAWQQAGLARDALYLVRPDTYVALCEPVASPEALARYVASHGLRLRP